MNKITRVLLAASIAILLIITALSFTAVSAQEPTETPTRNPFDLGDMLATRVISGTPVYGILESEPIPTLPPPVTATPCPQCLPPTVTTTVRGPTFYNLVTFTNQMFDGPRSWAIVMAGAFDPDQAQSTGAAAGTAAGQFFAGMAGTVDDISVILPVDIMVVVAIRLIIFLIIAFIGLIGKLKTAIKWW